MTMGIYSASNGSLRTSRIVPGNIWKEHASWTPAKGSGTVGKERERHDLLKYNDDMALARHRVNLLKVCCKVVVPPQDFWLNCPGGIRKQGALGSK